MERDQEGYRGLKGSCSEHLVASMHPKPLFWVSSWREALQEFNPWLPSYQHPCAFASFPACAVHRGKDLLMQKLAAAPAFSEFVH